MSLRRPQAPRRPVRPVRRRVLLAAVCGVVLLLLVAIEATDLLRHPPTGFEPPLAAVDSDPRAEVTCPGQDRGGGVGTGFGPAPAAQIVTSELLYDCPDAFDGQPVTYEGEVVGAVLRRGAHAWVHLNDDVYSGASGPLPAHRDYQGGNAGIGVRIPADLAARITSVGGAAALGDRLRVEGVFHRVHAESREPAVVIAESGEVAGRGRPFVDPVLTDRAVAALVLGLVAAGLIAAERVVALRRR